MVFLNVPSLLLILIAELVLIWIMALPLSLDAATDVEMLEMSADRLLRGILVAPLQRRLPTDAAETGTPFSCASAR